MSFQNRLLVTYLVLIILLVGLLGASFYVYSTGILERNAYSNLKVIAEKMSQQFDSHIMPMELLTTYLLSDGNILQSVSVLANINRSDPSGEKYVTEARSVIQEGLISYAIDRNFYRVSFFNTNGDFLTSNFRKQDKTSNISAVIADLPWREEADRHQGRKVVVSPYLDPWAQYDNSKVFGLVRMIKTAGENSYIEVQSPHIELERIFSIPEEERVNIAGYSGDAGLLYANNTLDDELLAYYGQLASMSNMTFIDKMNPVTKKREIIVVTNSDYTDVSIVLAQDKGALFRPFLYTSYLIVAVGFLVIAISFGYIYFFSKRLVKPIKELKDKIEATKLDNLPETLSFESSNDEIEALNASFQRLKERLTEAVNREIKAQSLQIQASFDSLQAQVNPHFIFNILNVLSNKGVENNDDEICEICEGIASMLRYSTSTLERSASIRDEIEHLSKYLSLMKKRFEHRLVFNIDIDNTIIGEKVPKIILQQVAENSIEHGFRNLRKVMEIRIRGYVDAGYWYIEITDNGEGFKPEISQRLQESIKKMERELTGDSLQTGYAIGGMGLINIYGRLKLFFKDNFVFELGNKPQGGAFVLIGGESHSVKGKDRDV